MPDPLPEETLQALLAEMRRLNERVSALEQSTQLETPTVPSQASTPPPKAPQPTAEIVAEKAILESDEDEPAAVESQRPVRDWEIPSHASLQESFGQESFGLGASLSSNKESLEKLIGGRWLTWLGAGSIALAVAFLLPWAWQHFQTPPWFRVLLFHLGGIALLGGAYVLARRKIPRLAHALAGLGIFTLYGSAFAMEHLYHLGGEQSSLLAMVDCAFITAAAIAIAIRYDSVAIILLGALGGYLTPLISAQGAEAFTATFGYLAFLNTAILATAIARKWNFLKPIGVAATALMFLGWMIGTSIDPWKIETMLLLHATLFLLGTTLPSLLWKQASKSEDLLALVGNSVWFFGATWLLFHRSPNEQLAAVCWGMALLHAVLFAVTYRRVTHVDRMPRVQLALAATFLTLAVPLQMPDSFHYLAYAWAAEGLAFSAIGVYFRDKQMAISALVVFFLAAVRALGVDFFDDPQLLAGTAIDKRMLVVLGTGVAMIVAGSCYWWVVRLAPDRKEQPLPKVFGGSLIAVGNLIAMLGLSCQWESRVVLVLWILNAALFWFAGFRTSNAYVRLYALLLSFLMVGGRMIYHGVEVSQPYQFLANARFATLALVAALYLVAGWFQRRQVASLTPRPYLLRVDEGSDSVLHFLGNLVLLVALSLEVHNWFDPAAFSHSESLTRIASASIGMVEKTTYSILWAVYAGVLVALGFLLKYGLMRVMGLAGLLLVVMKVFFIDLASLALFQRVLALAALGVMLLVSSFWYQKFASRIEQDSASRIEQDSAARIDPDA